MTSVGRPVVSSDSLLVRTAVELAERHAPSKGLEDEPWCLRCWQTWPCPPARHAREVCEAAGVAPPPATQVPPAVQARPAGQARPAPPAWPALTSPVDLPPRGLAMPADPPLLGAPVPVGSPVSGDVLPRGLPVHADLSPRDLPVADDPRTQGLPVPAAAASRRGPFPPSIRTLPPRHLPGLDHLPGMRNTAALTSR